jgi:acyl carrier protein
MIGEAIDVVQLFSEAVSLADGRTLSGLTLDTRLSELSLDSVAVLEAMGVLEQRLALRFNEEELSKVRTLRDLDTLVRKMRSAR